jgi:hypothetical protein
MQLGFQPHCILGANQSVYVEPEWRRRVAELVNPVPALHGRVISSDTFPKGPDVSKNTCA